MGGPKYTNINMRYSVQQRKNKKINDKGDIEIMPPTRDEISCIKCGFKARYKFFRCPECNAIQE